mmetsp:Transcript_52260/g.117405  ORF Transcript_52260/g.117405 Transcript_52260/m.117405 type:complete len:101 (-) Transcript_52260:153-455(-)
MGHSSPSLALCPQAADRSQQAAAMHSMVRDSSVSRSQSERWPQPLSSPSYLAGPVPGCHCWHRLESAPHATIQMQMQMQMQIQIQMQMQMEMQMLCLHAD